MRYPRASIVVPAHNEEDVLPRLLGALLAEAEPGELRVFVVCNGCNDRSAHVARRFAGVDVLELAAASKSAALNAGDRAAGDVFPRMYLDADIVVSTRAVRRVAEELEGDAPLAAAPRLHVVTDGRPGAVRGFYSIWTRLPWVTDKLVGSGFCGVSRSGRRRFGDWPELINDDLMLRSLFGEEERVSVEEFSFEVQAPHTTRALISAKARVAAGVAQFGELADAAKRARGEPTRKPRGGSLPLLRLMARPRNWPALLGFWFVRGSARVVRRWRMLRGRTAHWGQDRTTRTADARS